MSDGATGGTTTEIVYTLARVQWLNGWWAWVLALVAAGLVLYGAFRLARRDSVELVWQTRAILILLRVGLVVGLLFFLVGLERRARQRVTRPSEVAILVDTSQSMSLPQGDQPGSPSRIQAVTELVSGTPLVTDLAQGHRVTLYTFDASGELNEVIVSSTGRPEEQSIARGVGPEGKKDSEGPSVVAICGAALLGAGLLAMLAATALQIIGATRAGPTVLLLATVLAVSGGIVLSAVWTRHAERSLADLVGIDRVGIETGPSEPAASQKAQEGEGEEVDSFESRFRATDWATVLTTSGVETRIGDAIRATANRHDPSTLAGIILMTDGQNNAGTPPVAAAALVTRGGTAVYPIGFGSARPPTNVRIVDLDAPRRVYPGDKFALGVVLQGSGSQNLKVQVQLLDAPETTADESVDSNAASAEGAIAGGSNEAAARVPSDAVVVDSREVEVPSDGSLLGVRFEMTPEAVGRRRLIVRVVPPPGDQNKNDDVRQARYEVVSRRLRVLLLAGGPMREFQFVRNLLFRDESVEIDVWLQSGQAGISQDADRVLTGFPSRPEALFEYDAILAFDPNWLALDANQLDLLDQWLSRQAGGLVLISGPVYMPEWTRQRTDPRIGVVRNFFPVALSSRGPLLSTGRMGGDTAWPLEFTPDAVRADFLALDDDPQITAEAWDEFGGVYDFVGVNEAKPGARVYAYFSDPSAAIDDALPIYLASQFYGAGRVFFQGSGEMWRLRGVSEALFDSYYTKLVRWVSEGRLMRDSNRGILLVDRPRAMVGDTITIRAILTDAQFEPLRVPQVEAKLLTPSGRAETVRLTPLQGEPREGTYSGRVLVREPGAYELRVVIGNALEEQVLRQPIQVGLPTLELERPRRNDEVLQAMAATSGGVYTTMEDSSNTSSNRNTDPLALVQRIEPQPQPTILPGTPDRDFERRRNASLMWLLCSMLTMEWMVRRLHRLA